MKHMIYAYDENDQLLGQFRYSKRRGSPHHRWKSRMRNQGAIHFETTSLVLTPKVEVLILNKTLVVETEEEKLLKKQKRLWLENQKVLRRIALNEAERVQERIAKMKKKLEDLEHFYSTVVQERTQRTSL